MKLNTTVINSLPKKAFFYIFLSLFNVKHLGKLMYDLIFLEKRKPLNIIPPKTYKDGQVFLISQNFFDNKIIKEMNISVEENNKKIRLYADYLKNKNNTNITIIVAHGYAMDPRGMSPWISMFYDQGYNILLPHTKGHGKSEGKFHSMGIKENKHYIMWSEEILKKHKNEKIIFFGVSMGAATVLMLSGEKLSSNVKGIIADCPYTSVKEQINSEQIFNMVKASAPNINKDKYKKIVDYLEYQIHKKQNIFLEEVTAIDQVKKATVPIFLIHETNDNFVSSYMTDKLYDNISTRKYLYKVDIEENFSHGTSIAWDYNIYKNKIKNFIDIVTN